LALDQLDESSKRLAYSVDEACQALGIGRALAYELIMSGRLHSIKVGARRCTFPQLVWVELRGLEPLTPCLQSRCSSS
jgi:excisionase family DNA binding protein